MPTPFTAEERSRAREALLDAAHARFAADGIARTPLHALADAAGISKSSFYAFFASKEDLCLALLERMAPSVEARVLAPVRDPAAAPAEALIAVVQALRTVLREEPLLRRLVAHPEDLRQVAARVGDETFARKASALAPVRAFVAHAQAAGTLRGDVDAATVVAALQAVWLLELHADRLGAAHEAVVALWTEALAHHLVATAGSR